MTPLFKCSCCSTRENEIMITPVEKDGFLTCPHCGSIEIEDVEK
jgi:Zn finger protein HypA/HybF involved in hydrogenase expression